MILVLKEKILGMSRTGLSFWQVVRLFMGMVLVILCSDFEHISAIVILVIVTSSEFYRYRYAQYKKATLESAAKSHNKNSSSRQESIRVIARTPGWWLPVLNLPWLIILFFAVSAFELALRTGVSLKGISDSLPAAMDFFSGFLHPSWELWREALFVYARQTLDVALLGTFFGFMLALPFSFFCARNLMTHNPLLHAIYLICRLLMVVIRALPTFLLGLLFVAIVGLGPFPGVLAITLFSFGVMTKLFSEAIEAIEEDNLEAIQACGGSWMSRVRFAMMPQVLPVILAQLLYCLEINVHSASVLGLIGAEGIGLPINEYLSSLAYNQAAVFIYVVIAMTVVIDYLSAYLRSKIIN